MQTWADQSASTGFPNSRRYGHGMAYDPIRKRLVLFGGLYGATALNDTWELDYFGRWVQKTPATPPSARLDMVMTWDPVYQRVIMFGGYNMTVLNDDNIYEWDGTNWTTIAPGAGGIGGTLPGGRQKAAVARGPSLHYLFGGMDVSSVLKNDVYTLGYGGGFRYLWSGPFAPATRPAARAACSLHYLSGTSELLLFGGFVGTPTDGTTWIYNPATNVWTQIFPAVTPVQAAFHLGFTVYPFNVGGTERHYIFGGYQAGYTMIADLWWFNRGTNLWNQVTQKPAPLWPASRANHAGAWIPDLRQLYLYGGDTYSGNDTQTWGFSEDYIDAIEFAVDNQRKFIDPFTAFRGEMGFYPEV